MFTLPITNYEKKVAQCTFKHQHTKIISFYVKYLLRNKPNSHQINRPCTYFSHCCVSFPGVKVCWRSSLAQKPTRSGLTSRLSSTVNSPPSNRKLRRKPEQTGTRRVKVYQQKTLRMHRPIRLCEIRAICVIIYYEC